MEKYIELAKKIIEEKYTFAGVRMLTDDEAYKIGDICRESYDWDRENDCSTYHTTGLTAGGTCATKIDIDTLYYDLDTVEEEIEEMARRIETVVKQNEEMYCGEQQVIIAGYERNLDYDMTDDDEIRIYDAEVLMVLEV